MSRCTAHLPQPLPHPCPQGHGVGCVVAGGVEDQQLRPLLLGESEGVQTLDQLLCRRQIGPHQVGAQVFGLDAEVGQGARPLHQRPPDEGASRHICGQGQLSGGGFGVQLSGAIHDQRGGASLQQVRLPPQPGEHAVILQILSRPVQGQGKQDPVSRPQVQLLRGADGPPLPVRQGVGEDTGQADVRLRPARVWMDQNDGHEITFFKS